MSNCHGVLVPTGLSFLTMAVCVILSLLTVSGNSLVLLTVIKNNKKRFRTPFIIFLANMSLADLIVGILVEPISVYSAAREDLNLEVKTLPVVQYSYFFSSTASVLSLALLTTERYFAISTPLWYRSNASSSKAFVISGLVWIIGLSCSAIYFKVGFTSYAFVFGHTAVIFTLSIFLFTSIRIVQTVKLQLIKPNTTNQKRNITQNILIRRKQKLIKTLLFLIIFFLIGYIPSFVMIYFMNFCFFCSCSIIRWLRDLHFLMILGNSCVNPFIYAFQMPLFKEDFGNILRCKSGETANWQDVKEKPNETRKYLCFNINKMSSRVGIEEIAAKTCISGRKASVKQLA